MATIDLDKAEMLRRRLDAMQGGPSLGDKVILEGARQLSLPGAYARGALAGRPGETATSQELLGSMGVTHPSPLGTLAWDVATDPLTYAGPGLMKAGGQAADLLRTGGQILGQGPAANPLVNALRKVTEEESGALGLKFDPYRHAAEAGKRRFDPEWVNQRTFYHGTATPLESTALNPLKTSQSGLFGRGIYTTDEGGLAEPVVTSGYATARYGSGAPAMTDIQQALLQTPRGLHPRLIEKMHPLIDAEVRKLGGIGNVPLERTSSWIEPRSLVEDWYRQYQDVSSYPSPTHPSQMRMIGDFPRTLSSLYPENVSGLQHVAEQVRGLGVPLGEIASPRIYQSQSDFQKILDLEGPLRQYPNPLSTDLMDLARTYSGRDPAGVARMKDLAGRVKDPNAIVADVFKPLQKSILEGPASQGDPILSLLRSHGFDAMTHTGGGRWLAGSDPHQVVIGLDPNDVLQMGRASPYKQWEPYATVR